MFSSTFRIASLGLVAALLGTSAIASPVNFSVTPVSFTAGSGYGIDAANVEGSNGKDGTLLDAKFAASQLAQSFTLNAGQSFSFVFGTVTLDEKWIDAAEQDGLNVSAAFQFYNPLSGVQTVTATGAATAGQINDADRDLFIDWDDLTVNFDGGSFKISMWDLNVYGGNPTSQGVTIELLSGPAGDQTPQAATDVPEPASLALVGLALTAVGVARRRAAR